MTESPFSDDAFGFILRELDVRGLALSGCCCKSWQAHVARISAEPQFHAAMSRADNLQEAVNDVFDYCCQFSFRPNVAFVFLSDDMLEDGEVQVSAIFAKALAKLPTDLCLIGCTGVGLVGMDINSRQVLEVETTMDPKTLEPKAASGVSLALAKIPAATVHATLVRNKKDSNTALQVLQAQYPTETSASRSMRAMILANVKKRADQVLLTTLIQEVDAMWPSSEVTGGLASAMDPHASTLLCRPPVLRSIYHSIYLLY
jgi:small ligand-binding sensory domain FIST